jgi:hypothetical protein
LPAEAVGAEAVGHSEEFVGESFGDGAGFSIGDEDAVDGADGPDLGGGSGPDSLLV